MKAKRVPQVNMKLIQPILNHIKNCWASIDDECSADMYDYILQWFRQAFLEPWNKTGIVLLLYGLEGTGKGILIDNLIIPFIYGDTNACVSQGLNPLTQRFNSICMNKLFICCNEVSSEGGFHMSFDKLKAIITDKTISIEKKGIDVFKDYPNYLNLIFTTNNYDGVKLGKSDRRYCCIETSSKYKGDYDYFENLLTFCNQEVANHFYTYCIDMESTRNIRHIPRTQLKEDMMVNAVSSVEKYIREAQQFDMEEKRKNSAWVTLNMKWDEALCTYTAQDRTIPARHLYESYASWCRENHEVNKSSAMFGREAKSLLSCKKNWKGIMTYTL
jgi:phage/plasmid-associated DNA primase